MTIILISTLKPIYLPHSSAEMFTFGSGQWVSLPDMDKGKSGSAAAALPISACYGGGGIIVAGGTHNGMSTQNDALRLDIREKKWHKLAPMHKARSYTSGCMARGGRFFVSGGIRDAGYEFENSTEFYDVRMDAWEVVETSSPQQEQDTISKSTSASDVGGSYGNGNGNGDVGPLYPMFSNHNAPPTSMTKFACRASHHMLFLPPKAVVDARDWWN